MSTLAYPLQWPKGQERTRWPNNSKFKVASFARVRDEIVAQLKLMKANHVVISTNIPIRNDGLPYARFTLPDDAGVAVYFSYKGKQMVFACDKWHRIEDNLQAINKTIEAVRGIERWGSSEMMEKAFTGFTQIESHRPDSWWDILGVSKTSTASEIKKAYHQKCKECHPDLGGTTEAMARINKAYEDAGKMGVV